MKLSLWPARTDPTTTESSLTNEQFWTLYLAEHQQLANCWLHVVGTLSSWGVIVASIALQQWWLLILVPTFGYGAAWLGHLFVERNRPLSMKYPLRSLLADYCLTWQMLTGGRRGAITADPAPDSDFATMPAVAAKESDQ